MSSHNGFFSTVAQGEWMCRLLFSADAIDGAQASAEANVWSLSAIVRQIKRRYGQKYDTNCSGPENGARGKRGRDHSRLWLACNDRHLSEGGDV